MTKHKITYLFALSGLLACFCLSLFLAWQAYPLVTVKAKPVLQQDDPPGVERFTSFDGHMSFVNKPNWRVSEQKADGQSLITIWTEKANSSSAVKIFVSPLGYLGFDGLTGEEATLIGGQPGIKFNGGYLAGVNYGGYFYTFDAGLSPDAAIFTDLLSSVKFK